MGRRKGSRNQDFDDTRAALLASLRPLLVDPAAADTSLRELARAVGVSTATLRHYFGSRAGLVAAVLERDRERGAEYLLMVATGPLPPLAESLRWLLEFTLLGLHRGVLDVHRLGLAAGLHEPEVGVAYLAQILEPTLQAVEARLARHFAAGELVACDLRVAAVALIAPLLVAALHQHALGGAALRHLDEGAFLDEHLAQYLRAYAKPPKPPKPPARPRRPGRAS